MKCEISKRFMKYYQVDVVNSFNGDFAWAVAGAGCAPLGSVIIEHRNLDLKNVAIAFVVVVI